MTRVFGLDKRKDASDIRAVLMHVCKIGTGEYQEGWSDDRVSDYLIGDDSIIKVVKRIRLNRSKLLAQKVETAR